MNDTTRTEPIRSQCPACGLKRPNAVLNTLGNDCSDDFVAPDHPAFVPAEMAYRRGFTQALAELCIHAKDVPDDVRFWIKEYFDRCWEWRNEFRTGKRKEFCEPPPEVQSYPKRQ